MFPPFVWTPQEHKRARRGFFLKHKIEHHYEEEAKKKVDEAAEARRKAEEEGGGGAKRASKNPFAPENYGRGSQSNNPFAPHPPDDNHPAHHGTRGEGGARKNRSLVRCDEYGDPLPRVGEGKFFTPVRRLTDPPPAEKLPTTEDGVMEQRDGEKKQIRNAYGVKRG